MNGEFNNTPHDYPRNLVVRDVKKFLKTVGSSLTKEQFEKLLELAERLAQFPTPESPDGGIRPAIKEIGNICADEQKMR